MWKFGRQAGALGEHAPLIAPVRNKRAEVRRDRDDREAHADQSQRLRSPTVERCRQIVSGVALVLLDQCRLSPRIRSGWVCAAGLSPVARLILTKDRVDGRGGA